MKIKRNITLYHSIALDQYLKRFITKDKSAANYIKIGDAELNVFGPS